MTKTAAVLALFASGCAVPVSYSMQRISRAEFPPSLRAEAWDAAAAAFMEANLWIQTADGAGGILIAGPAFNRVACGASTCHSRETFHLLLCSDGRAILRVNREISGLAHADLATRRSAAMTPAQAEALQAEQDAFLASIVATPQGTPPAR